MTNDALSIEQRNLGMQNLRLSRRCDFDRDSASSLSAQKLPYVEPHKF